MQFKNTLLWVLFIALVATGCNKWEDHTQVDNPGVNNSLLQAISQKPTLSKFYEYLKKTGLDKELASSKTFTVWAPLDNALQSLDPQIVADSAKLRQFIANHISYQSYFTRNAAVGLRVPMLNGKWVGFASNKFDEATLVEADKIFANGVLHVIDKMAPVYPNAWELVNSTKTLYQQNAYILTLTRKVFDPANAIIDSVSALTGQPVYRPGTDSVLRNVFNFEIADLQNEEKLYTYFILNDAAFNDEVVKLNGLYKTSTSDSTKDLSSFAVLRDVIVEGLYTIDQLPAFLTTKNGVKIPIDKNKIVETRKMSNGIAYVMSAINYDVKEKVPTIIIQGESYRGFYRTDGSLVNPTQNNVSAILRRIRTNPLTGAIFNDIFVYNHGVSGLNGLYQAPNLPSVKYKVYWVAVNDTIIVDRGTRISFAPFQQRLAMGSRTATNFPLRIVAQNNFNEEYLGDYIHPAYSTLNMYLTANGTSPLTLDYIKLVPDL